MLPDVSRLFRTPHSQPGRITSQIFLSITIAVVATILTLSAVLYVAFEQIGQQIISTHITDNLQQISYSNTVVNDSAKSLLLQVAHDADVQGILFSEDPDPRTVLSAQRDLITYESTAPFAHSIYVYNARAGLFYTTVPGSGRVPTTRFFDREVVTHIPGESGARWSGPIAREIEFTYSETASGYREGLYTYIYAPIATDRYRDSLAVVLNVSEVWLRGLINTLDMETNSDVMVVDRELRMFGTSKYFSMGEDVSHVPFVQAVAESSDQSGYMVQSFDGDRYYVGYLKPSDSDLFYIRLLPYADIVSRIDRMRRTTIIVGAIILISGLGLSIALSRRLSRPIGDLFADLDVLRAFKRRGIPEVRRSYLRSLLQRSATEAVGMSEQERTDLGIMVTPDRDVGVLIVLMDDFARMSHYHSFSDHQRIWECAHSVVVASLGELGSEAELMDSEAGSVTFLVNAPDQREDGEIRRGLELIRERMEGECGVAVSTALGPFGPLDDLWHLYSEARDLSRYRLYYGPRATMLPSDVEHLVPEEYEYSQASEKALVDALMLEHPEEAATAFRSILQSALAHTYPIFRSVLSRLALAIQTRIECVPNAAVSLSQIDCGNLVGELNRCETIQAIYALADDVFAGVARGLHVTHADRYARLVAQIVTYVEKEYADPALSVSMVADRFRMSDAYLSRLFKRHHGESLHDFINAVRMGHAQELLVTTRLAVSEIAEQSGFVGSTYFYTLFKKTTGRTPSQFRTEATRSASSRGNVSGDRALRDPLSS